MSTFQIPYSDSFLQPSTSGVMPLSSAIEGWFAVYTRSNYEKRVASELTYKGFENYLPVVQEMHRWKDRNKQVETPVFPGYVFVRMTDHEENQLRVIRTAGAVRILGSTGRIEPIPDAQIESVRRLLDANVRCFVHPFLREGSLVRVKRGALKDLEGLLIRIKNETRLVLSISLLSQSVATEIDIRDVEVIRPAALDPRN
jgi:transcription termination/antitermination protein NusG